eukprot:6181317-Pleurochrysis_carterae.AAC.1
MTRSCTKDLFASFGFPPSPAELSEASVHYSTDCIYASQQHLRHTECVNFSVRIASPNRAVRSSPLAMLAGLDRYHEWRVSNCSTNLQRTAPVYQAWTALAHARACVSAP